MTKQVGQPSNDPIDALVEIMLASQRRMNMETPEPSAYEAFTLGQIMGIACRSPLAVERYKARAAEEEA